MSKVNILESREEIAKLDKSNMLGSIEALADQVKHAWEETQKLSFSYPEEIRNVVVVGMGGSALGADVFKNIFMDTLAVPFEVYNGYDLPAYANKNTLVILSSYSGTTEEVINCVDQTIEKQTQIAIITAGGELKKIAEENNYPAYFIDPVHNPSNQPRMALGYALIGLFGLMNTAGITHISQEDIDQIITTILRTSENLGVETPQDNNQAKLLAFSSIERRPVFLGSEFLKGGLHVAANQWNENAKMFADFKVIPEINHHLLEGLKFPKSNALNHFFVFFNSELYQDRNQKRMKITQQVVEQNEIETISVELVSETKLTQVFELITLMSYAGFYLSMLERLDPSPIPFVDMFKEELKK
ncbi:MAG: SIS domain-containing protein [Candidatus Pacebacteria bacterium]|jgi:glucose/mannose-6-phosphate isomerase|nr:SIS domain-containing protein [Candidatus Paceibacterota bacterium]MBT4651850.1 SIS domain-containing protein [Candidatus Paceibacterota bacterium]MBT6755656.1 SIS domain-containing protein [Candidatus Paceibacterota bacterium]MBT6921402.1 SIS domain-containing protein [Candidatus Paceibacterota bacterium]